MTTRQLLIGSIIAVAAASMLLFVAFDKPTSVTTKVDASRGTPSNHAVNPGSTSAINSKPEPTGVILGSERPATVNLSQSNQIGRSATKLPNAVNIALKGLEEFSNLYAELSKRSLDSLNNDEVSLLRYIQLQCGAVHSEASALRERVIARANEVGSARVAAANTLIESCKGVFSKPMESDELATEINRRQHALNKELTLAFQAATGNGSSAISSLNAALNQSDSLSVYGILSAVPSVAQVAEASVQGSVVSVSSADLNEAWTLALCQLSGSCGANSPDVLWRCAVSNLCGANSPEDALRRFEPERFGRVDTMRRNMINSISTHDWSWLMLSAPRSSASR